MSSFTRIFTNNVSFHSFLRRKYHYGIINETHVWALRNIRFGFSKHWFLRTEWCMDSNLMSAWKDNKYNKKDYRVGIIYGRDHL